MRTKRRRRFYSPDMETNRIIQAHLHFVDSLPPATSATPDDLNTTFIQCHRRIQALRALGDVNGYDRVLVPKILRAFPPEFCLQWIVHVKRKGLSEGRILKLKELLSEEVGGAFAAQKIREESTDTPNYIPSAAARQVSSKQPRFGRKDRHKEELFWVLCEAKGQWAQECKKVTSVTDRREKLKSAHCCFHGLNRGQNARACNKRDKASFTNCRRAHHRSI